MWFYDPKKDYSPYYNEKIILKLVEGKEIQGTLLTIHGPSKDQFQTGSIKINSPIANSDGSINVDHVYVVTSNLIESILIDKSNEMESILIEDILWLFQEKMNEDVYDEVKKYLLPNYINM